MQLKSDMDDKMVNAICAGLQQERIERYRTAADADGVSPLSLYVWNCNISAAFYHPVHFAEVTCRNSIHSALLFRNKDQNWYQNGTFRNLLDSRFLNELDKAIAEERHQHGDNITCHHIVSALNFGFWEHLTTKRFARYLFPKGFQRNFPNAPWDMKLHDLHSLIESVRRWRNRIAHHRAIFDKGPTRKYGDALRLIEWSSNDFSGWVSSESRVPLIINQRPKADKDA